MKTFIFQITAHVGESNVMLIYSQEYKWNITDVMVEYPIHALARSAMPFTKWRIDDGDDVNGTTYCQYVSYEKGGTLNYLLASWNELDEDGFVKLN